MADFSALKTSIQNYIKQNGNEEITGNLLQQILLSMVSTLGDSAINDLVTALNAEIANRGNADTTLQGNINSEATTRANADTELGGRITTLQGVVNGIVGNVENGYVYAGIATPSTTPVSGKVFYLALTAGTYTNFGSIVVPQGINILKYNGSAWSLDSFLGLDDAPTQGSNNLVKSGGVLDSIIKDGSAFDLSAYNNGATYADLSAALTALNALPAVYKKGGMSVKYVQTYDNKYVQYRCMANAFTTDVAQWQGVDNKPIVGSKNLVESGGIEKYLAKAQTVYDDPSYEAKNISESGVISDNSNYALVTGIELNPGESIYLNKGEILYLAYQTAIVFKTDSEGNYTETLVVRGDISDRDASNNGKVIYENTSNAKIYIGTCTYIAQRSYTIKHLSEGVSKEDMTNYGYAVMVAAANPEASANKVITRAGYTKSAQEILVVRMYPGNTADNLTLNINNTGALPLYYKGKRAGSSNCWNAEDYCLLWCNDLEYHLDALNDKDLQKVISLYGFTSSYEYNRFIREIYLIGLDSSKEYVLMHISKTSGGSYYFTITEYNVYGTVLAKGYLSADSNKVSLVKVEEVNSSGINGYAVVDWSVIPFGSIDLYDKAILNNSVVSDVNFSSTIYAYLKGEALQKVISSNVSWQNVYDLANDIKENRPYFLNDSYSEETSYDDSSYLDAKLRNIPNGKHFLFVTDSHIDYIHNGVAVNLRNKETQIMAYVKSKLNAGCVIFGGDAIGAQTGEDSDYRAAKILSMYAGEKFNAFGDEFLWCQGNHDSNGNTPSQGKIPSTEIYKRTTKVMQRFGNAVFDTEGINMIDILESDTDKAIQEKAWMNLHYYYDDNKNKIRFIVIESGDLSNGLDYIYWNAGITLIGYLTFIAEAMQTTPDGWDVVVVFHQLFGTFGDDGVLSAVVSSATRQLYQLIYGFKNHTSVSITIDGSGDVANRPILYGMMTNRIGSGKTYDFTGRTSGKIFIISGHFHMDDAWVIQTNDLGTGSTYKGKEYGQWETILTNSVLAIQVDRAQLNHKSSMAGTDQAPNAVTAENDSVVQRLGTTNEVLFDVVTITPDNKVVCTRIGAGSNRTYNLP